MNFEYHHQEDDITLSHTIDYNNTRILAISITHPTQGSYVFIPGKIIETADNTSTRVESLSATAREEARGFLEEKIEELEGKKPEVLTFWS